MASEEKRAVASAEQLVTEDVIRKVLVADKGEEAELKSFEVDKFTKDGDNYVSVVVGVKVKYLVKKEQLEASYVAKLNPTRRKSSFELDVFNQDAFSKESKFYLKTTPELNEILKSIGHPTLSMARCVFSTLESGKEQIYFEDLREKGFQHFDRRKGMDVPHAMLVLKELARLHASSLLVEAKYDELIEVRHDHLEEIYSKDVFFDAVMKPIHDICMNHTIQMLEAIGGYEKVILWLERLRPQIQDFFRNHIKKEKFNVACHGDCWNNNLLFRYGNDGQPHEVMLLDLQLCHKSSLAADLNYFMYLSLTGEVRKPNLKKFLRSYYGFFKEVLDAGGKEMPFTEEELMKEFRDMNRFGAIFAIMALPAIVLEDDDTPDMEGMDRDFTAVFERLGETAKKYGLSKPHVKERFLSIFDEFLENGTIV